MKRHPSDWQERKDTPRFIYCTSMMVADLWPEDEDARWTETEYDAAIEAGEAELARIRGDQPRSKFVELYSGTLALGALCRRMTPAESRQTQRDMDMLGGDEDDPGFGERRMEVLQAELMKTMVWPEPTDRERRALFTETYCLVLVTLASQFLQRHGLDLSRAGAAQKKR